MSNNKQSSIDLFIDQLEEKGNAYEENEGGRTINISIDISDYMELKIQAKEMEKQQKQISYADGYSEGYTRAWDLIKCYVENELRAKNNEQ